MFKYSVTILTMTSTRPVYFTLNMSTQYPIQDIIDLEMLKVSINDTTRYICDSILSVYSITGDVLYKLDVDTGLESGILLEIE